MRYLELSGTPLEKGRQHGEAFRKEIRELADIRIHLIKGYFRSDYIDPIASIAKRHVGVLQKMQSLYDEFSGIAEGAAIDPVDLMILNNYTDLRDFWVKHVEDEGGCSIFDYRGDNQRICGQTWDMHGSSRPYMVHLYDRDPIPTHVLTLTGCLALAGINSHGLGVFINNLHSSEVADGLMWPALVRGMLRMTDHRAAAQYLEAHLPCSGHNYLMADSTGHLHAETTGKRAVISTASAPFYFHTNHYLSELVETEIAEKRSKTSDQRYADLEQYFENLTPPVNDQRLAEEVLGGTALPSVSIAPNADAPHASATCGGIIYDQVAKKGMIFGGLYQENDHRPFAF